jgi:hypothetical protein
VKQPGPLDEKTRQDEQKAQRYAYCQPIMSVLLKMAQKPEILDGLTAQAVVRCPKAQGADITNTDPPARRTYME